MRYAAMIRRLIVERVTAVLRNEFGASIDWKTYVDASHNHARSEVHGGRELLVHRKGASPAAMGERGVIPGSMGTPSFHVIGRGCEQSMCSSSHGAGRVLSRTEAAKRISPRDLARQIDGVIVEPRSLPGLVEEAPDAYKDIRAVMRAQRELVKIERELRPLVSYKGW